MFHSISQQAEELLHLANRHALYSKTDSKTKVISITSGKGGVGKSTLTANMSYLLSLFGKKVLVYDADIGLANLQILFNLKPSVTYFDYIEKKVSLQDTILETKYKNVSLCAGKSGYQYTQSNSTYVYSRVIKDLIEMNHFDLILIDTGAGLSENVQEFLDISDEIIAVTTTDPAALTDVYALIKMLSLSKKKLFLLFNQTANFKIGETISKSLKDLALKNNLNRYFMIKYIGNVSVDLNIATTGRLRKLFVKEFEDSSSSLDLNRIVNSLVKEIL
jgi:flagellar biosynthesis protein FlhG